MHWSMKAVTTHMCMHMGCGERWNSLSLRNTRQVLYHWATSLALKMEFLMLKILYLKEALIISGFMKQSEKQTWKVQEYICGFFLVILAHCYVSLSVWKFIANVISHFVKQSLLWDYTVCGLEVSQFSGLLYCCCIIRNYSTILIHLNVFRPWNKFWLRVTFFLFLISFSLTCFKFTSWLLL